MIRVAFNRFCKVDDFPSWLDATVRAVPAESFAEADEGSGGITTQDIIDTGMIAQLGSFAPGSEVYVESEDICDCLDDETVETEVATHIWWRARIMMDGETLPEADAAAPREGSA